MRELTGDIISLPAFLRFHGIKNFSRDILKKKETTVPLLRRRPPLDPSLKSKDNYLAYCIVFIFVFYFGSKCPFRCIPN